MLCRTSVRQELNVRGSVAAFGTTTTTTTAERGNIVYLNGNYLPKQDAKISPQDRGFLFGDGIYEAIPFYQGRPFALEQHLQRLKRGLSFLRIPYPFDDDDHAADLFHTLIAKNQFDQSYFNNKNNSSSSSSSSSTTTTMITTEPERVMMYLQITRGAPMIRTHAFPSDADAVLPTVYAFCQEIRYPTLERWHQGFTCALGPDRRWGRVDIKTVNLLANVLSYQDAKDQNCDEIILHKDGMAVEGAHGNFWAVLDDDKSTIVTHPTTTHNILPGITRNILLDEARNANFVVEERPLTLEELRDNVKEAFFTSTTAELKPAVSIDGKSIGNGCAGNVTFQLWKLFRKRIERDTGVTMVDV